MMRIFQLTFAVLALGATLPDARAFSLLGPFDTWQTPLLGYNPPVSGFDIGGPQNLGEEYRWNVKTIYYGFDASFLDYFGSDGTAAVHAAFKIMNDLPPVSQMSADLSEFPTDTKRVNFQASALQMLDIKSWMLAFLVEELGLAPAERFAWTLRDRNIINFPNNQSITNYTVIQRNFDPVSLQPTPYVNGVLYTYQVFEFVNPAWTDAIESSVDPLAIAFSSVSSGANGLFARSLDQGEFYIGLTRDDIGGLRYLLRTNNFNTEVLDASVIATPTVVSNPPPPGSPANTPWTVITNLAVSQGLRPGVDKITFEPVRFDSLLGAFTVFTNTYTDLFVTNSVLTNQTVQRLIVQPDILIGADDLGTDAVGNPVLIERTLAPYINNDPINGTVTLNGPGQIQPQVNINFSKLGPYFFNQNPFFVDELSASPGFVWGSFDGTTNPPIVFPNSLSVQDLENQVLSSP